MAEIKKITDKELAEALLDGANLFIEQGGKLMRISAEKVLSPVDATLTMAGKAADAKATGDALRSLFEEIANLPSGGAGLTTAQISALDGMFKVCAYDSTKDYAGAYATFKAAFGITDSGEDSSGDSGDGTEVTLTSISVTYSGGDVAVGTAVSDLTGIVVTATYSDGSTENVTGYTLSGTIAEGENTITVTYDGMTTTFTVVGVAESSGEETTTPFGVEWTEGVLVNNGVESANALWVSSDYVNVSGKSEIRIYNDTGKLFNFWGSYYDDTQTYIDGSGFKSAYVQGTENYPSPLVLTIPDGAAYVRLSTAISANGGAAYYYDLTYELV